MRVIKRPQRWCVCAKPAFGWSMDSVNKALFDQKLGVYVKPCCGLPSEAYYKAALEAGVLP